MSNRSIVLSLLLVTGISTAFAQTTTRQSAFPPVGLGSGETAEVNIINVASNSSAGTAASCAGNITFTNAAGTTVGAVTPFTLASGQALTARLPFATLAIAGTRGVVRALISETIPTATPRPPCSLEFSFQTFDTATGATHSLLTGAARISGR